MLLTVPYAMLALLASKAPLKELQWNSRPAIIAFVALALIALTLFLLYHALFPRLVRGRRSLLYFREIAKRKETAFIVEFNEQSEEAYLKDLWPRSGATPKFLNRNMTKLSIRSSYGPRYLSPVSAHCYGRYWRNAEERRNTIPFGKLTGCLRHGFLSQEIEDKGNHQLITGGLPIAAANYTVEASRSNYSGRVAYHHWSIGIYGRPLGIRSFAPEPL